MAALLTRPLGELAREIRHYIRLEIRKVLQELEAEKRAALITRISTPDQEGAIHRWVRPTDKHRGQMVRPTAHLGMNPCHLPEMKLLDVAEPQLDFEFPFLCEDAEGNHKGFAHAWVEVQQEPAPVRDIQKHIEETLGLEPGSVGLTHINYAKPEQPKALEVEPVPAHPEPVEVKALEVTPGSTIYVHNGRTYRMVNSQDIGKEVYVSDRSPQQALDFRNIEKLIDIVESDHPHPYRTDEHTGWRFAVIEDLSLAVPAEPTKIDPMDEALIRSEEHFKEIFQLPPGAKLWTPDSPVAVEPVEEPKYPKYPKGLGPEWRFLEPEEIFQDGDKLTVCDPDKTGWISISEWYKGKKISVWSEGGSSYLAARRIDAKPLEFPIACEVVPAPDGSTTDPELPPLPPVEEEEVTGPELFYHEGKAYRLAGDEDLGKHVHVSDISFERAMIGSPVELTRYYYQETSKYGSYSTKWAYAFIEATEATEATEEPEAPAEPEWITPRPEHVGQMVEVRDHEEVSWFKRQLAGVVPEDIETTHRFITITVSREAGTVCPWKYARIRKA